MTNLLTLDYWFNLRPEALIPIANKLFIGLIILLVLVAISSLLAKRRNKLYRHFFQRIYNFSLTNILLGLILFFFNYEALPFFSARLWLGLWLIGIIIWLAFIAKALGAIPKKKKKMEEEKAFNKYLP